MGGIYARTNEWFAESPEHLATKWQKATGMTGQEISVRLFDSLYGAAKKKRPGDEESKGESEGANPHQGVLFAVSEDQCLRLRNDIKTNNIQQLKLDLSSLGSTTIKAFAAEQCRDSEDLKLAASLLLCSKE